MAERRELKNQTQIEPYWDRKDALGNVKRVYLTEWKRFHCPPGTTDETAVAFMVICQALDALPEAKDLELAVMKGKPVILIREQMFLKNMYRRWPEARFREGICDVNGKPKAISAPVKPDDYAWCDILDRPGGQVLIHFEAARSEWEKSREAESAWQKQPNHMLLGKCRKHASARLVPIEYPRNMGGNVRIVDEDEVEGEVEETGREAPAYVYPTAGAEEAEFQTPEEAPQAPETGGTEPQATRPPEEADSPATEAPEQPAEGWGNCPTCGSPLEVKARKGGRGQFLSCSAFPKCRYAAEKPKEKPQAAQRQATAAPQGPTEAQWKQIALCQAKAQALGFDLGAPDGIEGWPGEQIVAWIADSRAMLAQKEEAAFGGQAS
jgi:ssDNA-binding Zn-finger/Zn-ribbon topoisomerase 1